MQQGDDLDQEQLEVNKPDLEEEDSYVRNTS